MSSPPQQYLLLCSGTFVLSLVLTRIAIAVARHLDLLAHPVERSSHSIPTPQVGGIGICLSLLFATSIAGSLGLEDYPRLLPGLPATALWVTFALVVWGMFLGLIDDILALEALPKLAGQFVLSFLAVWTIRQIPLNDNGPAPWLFGSGLGLLFVFFWILFFTNAYNFMDGVNGQSGVFALNALGWQALMTLSLPGSNWDSLSPFLLIAAAILGFLPWNFPRPRTFLGDSGSLPIGALLALLAVVACEGSPARFVAFLLPLSLYLYDVLLTLIRRSLRGENVFKAHREHLYQRMLVARGWREQHEKLLVFHVPYYVASGALGYFCLLGQTQNFPLLAWIALAGVIPLLGHYTWRVLQAEKQALLKAESLDNAPPKTDTSSPLNQEKEG
jgi:UDP-N-acetylmuramyl pentapeptide phosphotransferase/UDP-N-acetylglucosamine-1-phosphate transferase